MDRKEIQTERMRGYFIQAAKEMIRSEGLKSVNVRSVAYRAGYSFATMYNYFRDINVLVFECVKDFQQEGKTFIEEKTIKIPQGKEKIRAIATAYADYLIEYPGIFELFYLEKMGGASNRTETSKSIYYFFDSLCEHEWQFCEKEGIYTTEEIAIRKDRLRFLIPGMLLFFENRLQPESYTEFKAMLSKQLETALS